ncbi:MAG: hypothetical protein AAGF02_04045, partial [Actinomycetota bacterium]
MSALLDVGGLAVEVIADQERSSVVRARFGPDLHPEDAVDVRLRIVEGDARRPVRSPDARAVDADLWFDGDRLVLARPGVRAERRGREVEIVVEPRGSHDDGVDLLCQYAVAAAAATPDRALLHGAALARDDGALVVVGSSGAGKSSLAAAAWRGGWDLLADDLVVVRRREAGGPEVVGVRRPPLLPAELLDDPGDVAELDARARRQLPAEVLGRGSRAIRAVVIVGHDDGAGRVGEIDDEARVAELIHGLAAPPVAPVLAAHLPVLAALGELPVLRLLHAARSD